MSTCCSCFRPKKVSINWLIDHIFVCAYSSIRGQLTKPINKLLKQIVSKCYELCTIPSFHPTEQGTEQRPRPRARNTQIDQIWIYFSPQRKKTKQKPGEVSVVWANLGLWLHTISLLTADSLKEHCTSDFDLKITTNRQICLNWIKLEPCWHRECLVRDAFSADHTRILKYSLQKEKRCICSFAYHVEKVEYRKAKPWLCGRLTFNHLKYLFLNCKL